MYLGIDLGTSGIKSVLIDESQNLIGQAHASLDVSRPAPGYSEQSPADWISAAEKTLEALRAEHKTAMAAVKGIAVSGQMHGATLLDSHDDVIRPCLLWNDTRSHVEAAQLDAMSAFRAVSGNIVFPGFTAPKVAWVKNHEPENFKRISKVLLPKDYLNWWLTGEYVGDYSDASGTSWLNVEDRSWSDELLAATDLSIEQMPTLSEGNAAAGQVRAELCQRFGFATPPVVAGGAGDNAASAIGMGIVAEGDAFVSLGTSGVLFTATDSYRPNAASAVHAFCHALPNTWHQMGVILSATDSLNWLASIVKRSAAELTQSLGAELKGPGELLFLPYLAGERTPHNDAEIRGAFLGLAHQSDEQALTHAVLEGVSYAIRDNLAALETAGTSLEQVLAVGGGARSEYWLQMLANVLDMPVQLSDGADVGAAFGAARLAQMAATSASVESVCGKPEIEQTFYPDSALASAYKDKYKTFSRCYSALSSL